MSNDTQALSKRAGWIHSELNKRFCWGQITSTMAHGCDDAEGEDCQGCKIKVDAHGLLLSLVARNQSNVIRKEKR